MSSCDDCTRFTDPRATLRELFGRLVLNVLIGNRDDHARNHTAFWNERDLTLTPAYALDPQPRDTGGATQAMTITRAGDRSAPRIRAGSSAAPPQGHHLQRLTTADAKGSDTAKLLELASPAGSRAMAGLGLAITEPAAVERLAAAGIEVRVSDRPVPRGSRAGADPPHAAAAAG